MHTAEFKLKGYDDVRIHHNGDWSGEVIVCWKVLGEEESHEARLPSSLFLELSKDVALTLVRRKIEELLDELEVEGIE